MKKYLGDSVYADYQKYTLILTTENGYGPSNEIHIEPDVIDAFFEYIEKVCSVKITVEKIFNHDEAVQCLKDAYGPSKDLKA